MKYRINSSGDLYFDGDIKPYIGSVVEFVKVCKSGLIQVRAHDGQLISIPKRNLDEQPESEEGSRDD